MFRATFTVEPDLNGAVVADSVLTKVLTDEEIFHDLIQANIAIVPADMVQAGDVVRVELKLEGKEPEIRQFVAGKGFFNEEAEAASIGCTVGAQWEADFYGEKGQLKLVSIKRIVPPAVDDALVALARMEGIVTTEQYRRKYVEDHREAMMKAMVRPVMQGIHAQLAKKTVMTFHDEDLAAYTAEKVEGLQRRAGGDEEAYRKLLLRVVPRASEEDTLEKLTEGLHKVLRDNYTKYAIGKFFAEKLGMDVTEQDYEREVEETAKAEGAPVEAVRQQLSFASFAAQQYEGAYFKAAVAHLAPRIYIDYTK